MSSSSKLIRRALLGMGALALTTLLATPSWAQNLEPIKVRLDWTPWANHAAFHLAQQKGWYRQAGFDICGSKKIEDAR